MVAGLLEALERNKKMKTNRVETGVLAVAKIVHLRGDCTSWGAVDDTLEACIELVQEVQEMGNEMIESGEAEYDTLQDLLQDELGLEPDYIEDLWIG